MHVSGWLEATRKGEMAKCERKLPFLYSSSRRNHSVVHYHCYWGYLKWSNLLHTHKDTIIKIVTSNTFYLGCTSLVTPTTCYFETAPLLHIVFKYLITAIANTLYSCNCWVQGKFFCQLIVLILRVKSEMAQVSVLVTDHKRLKNIFQINYLIIIKKDVCSLELEVFFVDVWPSVRVGQWSNTGCVFQD